MTYEELQARIAELENAGLYNTHINPVNEDNVIKVDEHYPYIHKPFFKAIGYFLTRLFIVKPFSFYKNHFEFHTKYVGRENLKGIKGAVVTSNHVDIFDCLANFKVLHGHKVRTIAAPFNNFKGFLGTTMRAQN